MGTISAQGTPMIADVLSAADWWRGAGVDAMIGEEPHDWLASPKPSAAVPTLSRPANVPDSLEAIARIYATDDMFGPVAGRLLPQGSVASGLMLMTDQPEQGDAEAGQIVSGEAGRLFDRMLAAIGRDRAAVDPAHVPPVSSTGGGVDAPRLGQRPEVAGTHVGRAAPPR